MDNAVALKTADEVVSGTRARGGEARVLGGIGVAIRCPSAATLSGLTRTYSDIDLVAPTKAVPSLKRALDDLGYEPERRFNAVHGHQRLMFDHPSGMHVDVFVDEFVMCHRLDLCSRLNTHPATVSLADLLLTKVQVANLNVKDVTDAAALLLDHDLTDSEAGLNVDYITSILSRDWGWWRTVTHNLTAIPALLNGRLTEEHGHKIESRLQTLLESIATAPKGMKWRARAKVGDRVPWRDEPEESH